MINKMILVILFYPICFALYANIINGDTHYEIISLLGDGSAGIVYLAKQSDGTHVALKQMHFKQDLEKWLPSQKVDSFFENGISLCAIQELQISQLLTHPHILKIHQIFNAIGNQGIEHTYVVMDYVGGATLRHTQNLSHSCEQAKQNVTAFLDAIAFALSKGYFYEDLSSSNLMFNKNKEIKIIDLSGFEPINETFLSNSTSYLRSLVHYSLEILRKGNFSEMEMQHFQNALQQISNLNELLDTGLKEF